jgi:hypothetical protein
MIRRIDPDEPVTINGVAVTGRQLAEARQELSHRGVHNPCWSELPARDQEMAALAAGSYLRSLADLVPSVTGDTAPYAEGDWTDRRCDGCGKSVATRTRTGQVLCTTCHPGDLPIRPSGRSDV